MTQKQHDDQARTSDDGTGWISGLSSLAIPIIVILVVVVLAVALAWSSGSQRSQTGTVPGDLLMAVPTAQPQASGPVPHPAVPRITLRDAVDVLEQGQAVLIDVRSRSSYDKAHATGALSFPENEVQARFDELPAGQSLILYWTWGQEQQSARVAQTLMDQGRKNVHALLGGFAAWQRAGLPIETSTK